MIRAAFLLKFLTALAFTIAVETIFLYALLRFFFKKHDIPTSEIFAAGVFASFSTLPYVWFVFPFIYNWPGTAAMWSEPFVFVVEAIFYKLFLKLDWKTAFVLSLICNLASYAIGHGLIASGFWFPWW